MDDFRTAALVAATNAWWAGRLAPDDVVSEVGAGLTISFPPRLTLLAGLARLRDTGASALFLALPRPGDPTNLVAAPETVSGAIAAGSVAVTAAQAPVALVPDSDGWTVAPAHVPAWPDAAAARRDLLAAIISASDEITALDLGRSAPGVAAGVEQRLAGASGLARLLDARAAELALRAARVLAILDEARAGTGSALTSREMADEGRILGATSELEAAARNALAAAVNDAAHVLAAGR